MPERQFQVENNQFLLRIQVHILLKRFQSEIWNLCFLKQKICKKVSPGLQLLYQKVIWLRSVKNIDSQSALTVCKSLSFFGLTGCIFCDPSKHQKHVSVKVRPDNGRQSCDSWNSNTILSYFCLSCLMSVIFVPVKVLNWMNNWMEVFEWGWGQASTMMKETHASLLVIEQSHSSFDCLQWREIGLRSFDLDLWR